jgi:hypothetical protein
MTKTKINKGGQAWLYLTVMPALGVPGQPGGDVTNVQYKLIWNCHYESPLYNKYILILKK